VASSNGRTGTCATSSDPDQRPDQRPGRPGSAGRAGGYATVMTATCNLCPPGRRDVADDAMAEHLRTVHPEAARDVAADAPGSTIVQDASLEPVTEHAPRPEEWRS
jgi:hypothetical protein